MWLLHRRHCRRRRRMPNLAGVVVVALGCWPTLFSSSSLVGEDAVTCTTGDADFDCRNQGICRGGKCFCAPGFSGELCTKVTVCAYGCSSHGYCHASARACACLPGWTGPDCSQLGCYQNCSDHGVCVVDGARNNSAASRPASSGGLGGVASASCLLYTSPSPRDRG